MHTKTRVRCSFSPWFSLDGTHESVLHFQKDKAGHLLKTGDVAL